MTAPGPPSPPHQAGTTKPLKRRPTLLDVAELAQVSKSTVSNVINDNQGSANPRTVARVRQAMKDLHYYPNSSARALRSREVGTLAFLVLDEADKYLADPLTTQIMAGVGDALRERDYSLLIHTVRSGGAPENLFSPLLRRSVDGAFVLISGDPDKRRWYIDKLNTMEQPVVVFDEVLENDTGLSVRAGDRDAGRMLTEHLLAKGHRRVAFMATRVPTALIEQRYLGYTDALHTAGIHPNPKLTLFDGVWEPAGGAEMATRLMDQAEPPTAIICGHDVLAIGTLHTLQERGVDVPAQVAVASFDDYNISAWVRPTLTSVQLPSYQMGRVAASMLLGLRNGVEPDTRQVVLPVQLICRDSS